MGLGWLACKAQDSSCLCLLSAGLAALNVGVEDLNSDTHTCMPSVLLSELSPVPPKASSVFQDSITTNPVLEDKGMTPSRLPTLQGRLHSRDALGKTTWTQCGKE